MPPGTPSPACTLLGWSGVREDRPGVPLLISWEGDSQGKVKEVLGVRTVGVGVRNGVGRRGGGWVVWVASRMRQDVPHS